MSKVKHVWVVKRQAGNIVLTESELLAMAFQGQLLETDRVFSETRTKKQWVSVSQIPDLIKKIEEESAAKKGAYVSWMMKLGIVLWSLVILNWFFSAGKPVEFSSIKLPPPRILLDEGDDYSRLPERPEFAKEWPHWKTISTAIKNGTMFVEFLDRKYRFEAEGYHKVKDIRMLPEESVAILDFRDRLDSSKRLLLLVRYDDKKEDGFLDSAVYQQSEIDERWKDDGIAIEHHFDGKHIERRIFNGKTVGREIVYHPNGNREWDRFNGRVEHGVWFEENGSIKGKWPE